MTNTAPLKEKREALKAENPRLRIKDAATALGVTEVELLVTDCGQTVTRLDADWQKIYPQLPELGKVMALTRNEASVLEQNGIYGKASVRGPMALTVGNDIDLRSFLTQWGSAFVVTHPAGFRFKYSLQVFSIDGHAIHKIYLNDESNLEVFEAILAEYKSEDQSTSQEIKENFQHAETIADAEIDKETLITDWEALQDVHDFMKLLKKHKISRTQAYKAVSEEKARQIKPEQTLSLLNQVSASGINFMIFNGNRGQIQIYMGPAKKIVDMDEWLNILDPQVNLHLKKSLIDSAWVVTRPTVDGNVTSVELFDKEGETLVSFFGKRKEGQPELPAWRKITDSLK